MKITKRPQIQGKNAQKHYKKNNYNQSTNLTKFLANALDMAKKIKMVQSQLIFYSTKNNFFCVGCH